MRSQPDYRNHQHGHVTPQMDDNKSSNNISDDEVKYQRAASILRDFHSTHCCPPLNVIHEDLDDDDSDYDDSNNNKLHSERHLFEFSGLISRSTTVTCLAALAQQEGSAFRKEQEQENSLGLAADAATTSDGEDTWGYYTASAVMLSTRNTQSSNRRVETKPSSFSSRRPQSSPTTKATRWTY